MTTESLILIKCLKILNIAMTNEYSCLSQQYMIKLLLRLSIECVISITYVYCRHLL